MSALLDRRHDALLVLALVGVGVGIYLSWVALVEGQEAFCSGIGDCHTVQSSQYAKVAGVPVALLGLGMYASLLGLIGARRFWTLRRDEAPPQALASATFALALSGALYSAYLTYLELFEIDAICVWCVTSAAIVAAILVLCVPDLRRDAGPVPRSTV